MAGDGPTARWVVPDVHSVRFRLTALVLLAMLATVGVVVGLMFATADGLFLRQAISELERQNQASSLQIEDLTDRAAASLLITRHSPDFARFYQADPNDTAGRAAALENIGEQLLYLQHTFAIDEICLISAHAAEDARCVQDRLATVDELSPDESRNPFFAPTIGLSDGDVYRSTVPYMSPDSHRYVVAHATPLVLSDGQHVAILHFEIPLIWFAARVRETSIAGASSFLLNRDGDLIVPPLLHGAPEPDYWPPALLEAHDADDAFPNRGDWGSPGFRAMAASLRPGTSGATSFADAGEDYEVVYQPTFAGHWILGTLLPHSAIFAPASELVGRTILLVVPLLLLGLVLTAWYGSHLLQPLKHLAGALRAVGSGDLNHVLGSGRDDEIGQLGHAFDRMSGELRSSRAQQAQADQALRANETRYRQMFEGNQAVQLLIDPTTTAIVDANPAACSFYGHTRDELLQMRIGDLNVSSAEHLQALVAEVNFGGRREFVTKHRLASGEIRDVQVHSSRLADRGRGLLYSIVHDVTERLRAESALRHQALHDALTDLPNRALLYNRLHDATSGTGAGGPFALLVLDLDRFKEVNDTLGHAAGDALLREMGARLRNGVGSADLVARLGGDEFALLLADADAASASGVAARLVELLSAPVVLDEHEVEVGASIGIALYPADASDVSSLMRRADLAMYSAKRNRGGFALFSPDQDLPGTGRLSVVAALRRAISGAELTLVYQPKVVCGSGELSGVEALVRWNHPERGLVPPDQFITLAEQTGLIKPLTRWVLEAALSQWHAWQLDGLEIPIAVNLSAHDVQDADMPHMVAELLKRWEVPASALKLEITESALVADPGRALNILSQVCATGVRVAIDDFGTGYSSLAYLKRLPIHEIKVDRTFIRDMTTDAKDLAIVRSTIELGHNLGLETVAEGVEDQVTLELLASMGCDVAQGFHISRPLPPPQLAAWCRAWRLDHQTLSQAA